VPGRKSAAETPGFLTFPPSAALYYKTLPHALPVPSPANFQEVEKIFIRNYVAMMSDELPIAEGVKRTDKELNESFKRLAAQQAKQLENSTTPPGICGRRLNSCGTFRL
jgi:multiple sugar transport system substrate-binding protein